MNSSSSNGEQESQREEETNPIDEENDPALARSEYEENYQNKGKPQLNGHQSKKGLNASDLELNDLEMRGLEEEEMFLRLVRDQREKMERIKNDFDRKERLLIGLNKENEELVGRLEEMREAIETLQHKQSSMETMKSKMAQIEEKSQVLEIENAKLKAEAFEKETNERFLTSENKKLKMKVHEIEKMIENQKRICNENENILLGKLEDARSREKSWDQDMNQIKYEYSKIKDQAYYLEKQKEEMSAMEQEIDELKQENSELEKELNEAQGSLEKERVECQKIVAGIQEENRGFLEELREMQGDIENQSLFIKRQADLMRELEARNKAIKEELQKEIEGRGELWDEIDNLSKTVDELREEKEELIKMFRAQSQEMIELRLETQETKKKLALVLEKQEKEKKTREEYQQNVIASRQDEMKKFSDLFSSILSPGNDQKGASLNGQKTSKNQDSTNKKGFRKILKSPSPNGKEIEKGFEEPREDWSKTEAKKDEIKGGTKMVKGKPNPEQMPLKESQRKKSNDLNNGGFFFDG